MKRSMTLMTAVLLSLSSGASAQSLTAAPGTCKTKPVYAYNGQIKIKYPSGNGKAQIRQVCTAKTVAFAKALQSDLAKKNTKVKWVEFYEVDWWFYSFYDLIYKFKPKGYSQAAYEQWNLKSVKDSSMLVYGHPSGKYVAMMSVTQNNTSGQFILFGN